MSLQPRAELSQGHKFFDRKESLMRQHAVEGRHAVTFGENETVAFWIIRMFGINAQVAAEIKHGQEIDGGKGSSGMARAGGLEHADDIYPESAGQRLQIWHRETPFYNNDTI